MRFFAALIVTLTTVAAVPVQAQEIPVGGNQAVDTAVLLELLAPVIRSLGATGTTSLDSLGLNSSVGAGDMAQFSEIFKAVGFDGAMNSLLSSLSGLSGVDFASLGRLAGPSSQTIQAPLTAAPAPAPPRPAAAPPIVPGLARAGASPVEPTRIRRSTETINGRSLAKYTNLPASPSGSQPSE